MWRLFQTGVCIKITFDVTKINIDMYIYACIYVYVYSGHYQSIYIIVNNLFIEWYSDRYIRLKLRLAPEMALRIKKNKEYSARELEWQNILTFFFFTANSPELN